MLLLRLKTRTFRQLNQCSIFTDHQKTALWDLSLYWLELHMVFIQQLTKEPAGYTKFYKADVATFEKKKTNERRKIRWGMWFYSKR